MVSSWPVYREDRNFEKEEMSIKQIKAGHELVMYLLDKYSLLKGNIKKHNDFGSTACPRKKLSIY